MCIRDRANQVYNPVANEYDPDRGVTPLVILPEVIANAADGSWDMPVSYTHLKVIFF